MLIHSVKVNGLKAGYNYFENKELIIELDKEYKKNEQFNIYVSYTSQPEKVVELGVTDQKGLYFISVNHRYHHKFLNNRRLIIPCFCLFLVSILTFLTSV